LKDIKSLWDLKILKAQTSTFILPYESFLKILIVDSMMIFIFPY